MSPFHPPPPQTRPSRACGGGWKALGTSLVRVTCSITFCVCLSRGRGFRCDPSCSAPVVHLPDLAFQPFESAWTVDRIFLTKKYMYMLCIYDKNIVEMSHETKTKIQVNKRRLDGNLQSNRKCFSRSFSPNSTTILSYTIFYVNKPTLIIKNYYK